MSNKKPLPDDWMHYLQNEFNEPYMNELRDFLIREKKSKTIFPPMNKIFNAFNLTNFNQVKAVILGQDPYHNQGQAHGLAFSVPKGISPPPSLINIFKEIKNSFKVNLSFENGDLTAWAKQGVFLLNSVLTVEKNHPAAHKNRGWEIFTDRVITLLSQKKEKLVFFLWGKLARNKKNLIAGDRHLVLEAAHPSPFSAEKGFFGCNHFVIANHYLRNNKIKEINWVVA